MPLSRQSLQRSGGGGLQGNKTNTQRLDPEKGPATDRCSVSRGRAGWGGVPRKILHLQRAGLGVGVIWALSHGLGGNQCPRGRGFLELSRSPRPAGKIHQIGFRTSARRRPRAGTSPHPLPAQTHDSRNPLRGASNGARLPGNRLPVPALAGVIRSDARRARARCMTGARGFRPARGRAVQGG